MSQDRAPEICPRCGSFKPAAAVCPVCGGDALGPPAQASDAARWTRGPTPRNEAIAALLRGASRVLVYDRKRWEPGGANVLLLDAAGPDHLPPLTYCLEIDEEAGPQPPCFCPGDLGLHIRGAGDALVGELIVHHGETLDCGLLGRGRLKEGRRLGRWLSNRGVPGPLAELEDIEEQRRRLRERSGSG
jgi:hypothetical protein